MREITKIEARVRCIKKQTVQHIIFNIFTIHIKLCNVIAKLALERADEANTSQQVTKEHVDESETDIHETDMSLNQQNKLDLYICKIYK